MGVTPNSRAISYEGALASTLRIFRDDNGLPVKVQQKGGYASGGYDAAYLKGRRVVAGFDAKMVKKAGDCAQPTRYVVHVIDGKLCLSDNTAGKHGTDIPEFEALRHAVESISIDSYAFPFQCSGIGDGLGMDEQDVLAKLVESDYKNKGCDFVVFGDNCRFAAPADAGVLKQIFEFGVTVRHIRRGTASVPKKHYGKIASFFNMSMADGALVKDPNGDLLIKGGRNLTVNLEKLLAKGAESKGKCPITVDLGEGKGLELLASVDPATGDVFLRKRGKDTCGQEYSAVIWARLRDEDAILSSLGTDCGWYKVHEHCLRGLGGSIAGRGDVIIPSSSPQRAKRQAKFQKDSKRRVENAVKALSVLAKCSNTRDYEYTAEEVDDMFQRLWGALDKAEKGYA